MSEPTILRNKSDTPKPRYLRVRVTLVNNIPVNEILEIHKGSRKGETSPTTAKELLDYIASYDTGVSGAEDLTVKQMFWALTEFDSFAEGSHSDEVIVAEII